MSKVRRNEPCPCGSGRKYKKCHGHWDLTGSPQFPAEVLALLERHRAEERIREAQQGLGRPIIGPKMNDQQIVAVGNTIHYSSKWKTFPDFLGYYIKRVFGTWGDAELKKPLEERHTILQWYDAYCRYQTECTSTLGEVKSSPINGVVACYLGLAYSLYLLAHNVELQARFVHRLKNPDNFQGVYYELLVANALIRAGFTLTLEDETDGASKHCEFVADSWHTGKRYWVEAKMRSVAGLFGKTERDASLDERPLSKLIPHLNKALAKPADDERLIFIDLNAPHEMDDKCQPDWLEPVMARLGRYEEKELEAGVSAYVFVTNIPFHRDLGGAPLVAVAPYGLGLPDFNRREPIRISEAYRRKQKHIDAYRILEAFSGLLNFTVTFDGTLPSEALYGEQKRVLIGETYHFEGIGVEGLIGTVTAATVNEQEKITYIAVTGHDDQSLILTSPMSDEALADYKAHPDAYFGRVETSRQEAKTPFELFEWLMEVNNDWERDQLLEAVLGWPDFEELKRLPTPDLLSAYCEGLVASVMDRNRQKR